MKNKIKRKYLVAPRYQLSQAGIILLSHLLVALLVTGLLSWVYLFMLNSSIAFDHNRQIPWFLAAMVLLITAITTWWVIRHSHRVAGAMFKVDQTLSRAAKGDCPDREISFRKGDHFPQLAASINDCLKGLQACHKERDDIITDLAAVQARLKEGQLSSEEAAGIIQETIDKLNGFSPEAEL